MRFRPVVLLVSGVIVASSACSMDATAPSSLAAPDQAAMAKGKGGAKVSVDGQGDRFARTEPTTYTVTIDPRRANTLHFGPHTLEIPANAICDAKSGYGLESFNQDCKTRKEPVTITAIVRATAAGVPRIDIEPEMRFSPKRVVTLSLYVPNLSSASAIPRILYCSTFTTEFCVDEADLDPTLAPRVDYGSSTLVRRIRHFCGYFVEW